MYIFKFSDTRMFFPLSLGCAILSSNCHGGDSMEKKFQKWILEDERGKRPGQKFKSLLVMQYILKYADDEHPVTIGDIEGHYGIEVRCINPSVSLIG